MRKSSVLCCALCFLLSLITDTGALSFWGPPDCARSWISDGVKDYNEIAKMFFPEANMPGRDYNYRFTEIELANGHANVTIKPCNFCSGYSPKIPEAHQKILIPPCTWGEGCRAAIPLNFTTDQNNARKVVSELGFNGSDIEMPYVLSTGELVGPGQVAYVFPCKLFCCHCE